MWPTFYIPFAITGLRRPFYVAQACAYASGPPPSLTINVPLPSGIQAGDVLLAHAAANSTGGAPSLSAPAGWIQFSRLASTSGGVFGTQGPTHWKIADAQDAADAAAELTRAFTFATTTVLMEQRICIAAFRDVDQDQPFGAMNLSISYESSAAYESAAVRLPPLYPSDPGGAYLGFVMGTSNSWETLYENAAPVENSGDFKAAVDNVFTLLSGQKQGNYLALWHPDNQTELENLIDAHRRNFNTWDKWNATVNDSYALGDATFTRISFSGTTSAERKAISKTVELTAGEKYTFVVMANRSTMLSGHRIWVSVSDGTNEHGVYADGIEHVDPIGSPDGHYTFEAGPSGTAGYPVYVAVAFTAQVTGTHTLWIGAANSLSQETTSSLTPLNVWHAQLYRGHFAPSTPRDDLFIEQGDSAVIGLQGYNGRIIQNVQTSAGCVVLGIELRRVSGRYSLMRMEPLHFCTSYYMDSTGQSNTGMIYKDAGYGAIFRCSAPVMGTAWSSSGTGKHYAEITVGTFEAAADKWFIGTHDMRQPDAENTGAGLSIQTRVDSYCSDGKIYENGSLKGTYSTYGTGDVIGIAIDFPNNECSFYKNGTLVATCTATTGDYPRWLWIQAGVGVPGRTDTFTANLTGPFLYKPSGYQAWDWNNEAT